MSHRVVEKQVGQIGFVVLKRNWLVGRFLVWLSHRGGLLTSAQSSLFEVYKVLTATECKMCG